MKLVYDLYAFINSIFIILILSTFLLRILLLNQFFIRKGLIFNYVYFILHIDLWRNAYDLKLYVSST